MVTLELSLTGTITLRASHRHVARNCISSHCGTGFQFDVSGIWTGMNWDVKRIRRTGNGLEYGTKNKNRNMELKLKNATSVLAERAEIQSYGGW